jgi:hypothetical protein
LLRYWPLSAAAVIHHEEIPPVPPPSGYQPGLQETPNPSDEP